MSESSIGDQLKQLAGLQEIDFKIVQLDSERRKLPQVLKERDQRLVVLQKDLDSKQTDIDEIQKGLRQMRAAIELNEERIKRASEKMELVKSGNEFNAAHKETDQLNRQKKEFDEKLASLEKKATDAQTAFDETKKSWDEEKTARDQIEEEVNGKAGSLETEIASLSEGRSPFLASIEKPLLARYDRVRKARAGVGMAYCVSGRCKACNMVLPPQQFNVLLRAEEVMSCPSCQRILCAIQDETASPEEASS